MIIGDFVRFAVPKNSDELRVWQILSIDGDSVAIYNPTNAETPPRKVDINQIYKVSQTPIETTILYTATASLPPAEGLSGHPLVKPVLTRRSPEHLSRQNQPMA